MKIGEQYAGGGLPSLIHRGLGVGISFERTVNCMWNRL